MVKSLKEIQQENRRLILEVVHDCSYEEALEKDFLEATSKFTLFTGYKGDFDDVITWLKITGKPITLSRVLFALPKNIGFIAEVCPYDNRNLIIKKSYYSEDYCVWDLTKQTLEEQSEETQREINEMIK
jgi:hypothetical protein